MTDEKTTIAIRLDPDAPLTDPNLDRLGYAPFAKQMAHVIGNMAPTEGVVLGLYGPWGSGKTTVINFIRAYLRELPEFDQPVFFEFNPWLFAGREELTRKYFQELLSALKKHPGIGKSIAKKIGSLADIVSESPLPKAGWAKTLSALIKFFCPEDTLFSLKEDVTKVLRESRCNIIVFIDDIDRLTAEETLCIFQLAKAVGNLPRTIFLLAFDRIQVCSALKSLQENPDKFLEKIVQVPYELPLPNQSQLHQVFSEKLDTILSEVPQEKFDTNRWASLFHFGIGPVLQTPRSVARLTNAIATTFPTVKNEVNPVDFIAIENIRITAPEVYKIIRQNQNMFTDVKGDDPLGRDTSEADRPFYDTMINSLDENLRTGMKKILSELFPRLESIWNNTMYGGEILSVWARDLRICHPDHFATYFRFAVPDHVISNSEIQAMLAIMNDPRVFETRLEHLATQKLYDGTSRLRQFLIQLENFTDEGVKEEFIGPVVLTFFRVADRLYQEQDEVKTPFDFSGNFLSFGRISHQLLKRLNNQKRFEVLEKALNDSDAIGFISWEVGIFEQEHEKSGQRTSREEEQTVSMEELQQLKEIALNKIREAAESEMLLASPHLPNILARWKEWANLEEVREWAGRAIATANGLTLFLEHFLSKSFIQGFSDHQGTVKYRLDPKTLDEYFNVHEHIGRIEKLAASESLTPNQGLAVEALLKWIKLQNEGKDPENLMHW